MKLIFTLLLTISLPACAMAGENTAAGEHKDELRHEHTAPHGGTLIVIGDEFAHLELVLEPETGKLTGYVLDGGAENPVRLEQEQIELKIDVRDPSGRVVEKDKFHMELKAVPNVLTGETTGDSSEFANQSGLLKGVGRFYAVITAVTIKGKEFRDIEFTFPEGNE